MPKKNHRRKNRAQVDRRQDPDSYKNGYARGADDDHQVRVGRTGFLDKSMHGWCGSAPISGRSLSAHIGNDYSRGHRGMARAVAGAKKFIRSRVRFHENAAARREARESLIGEDDT